VQPREKGNLDPDVWKKELAYCRRKKRVSGALVACKWRTEKSERSRTASLKKTGLLLAKKKKETILARRRATQDRAPVDVIQLNGHSEPVGGVKKKRESRPAMKAMKSSF